MSAEIASICVNLGRIAKRAAGENQPLVGELAREIASLCQVVLKLEQTVSAGNGNAFKQRPDAG
jgi:hypothetical protein